MAAENQEVVAEFLTPLYKHACAPNEKRSKAKLDEALGILLVSYRAPAWGEDQGPKPEEGGRARPLRREPANGKSEWQGPPEIKRQRHGQARGPVAVNI